MPRTIESIVNNHKATTALRAAGKPIWNRTIDIKTFLHENQDNFTPSHIVYISTRLAEIFRARLPDSVFDIQDDDYDFDFVDTIEQMEECTLDSLAIDKENGIEAVNMFNDWLDSIYDWADRNRVWLG